MKASSSNYYGISSLTTVAFDPGHVLPWGARERIRSGRTDPCSKVRPAPGRKRRRWRRLDNRPYQVTRSQVVDEYHGLIAWPDLIARSPNSSRCCGSQEMDPSPLIEEVTMPVPIECSRVCATDRDLIIVSRRGQEHGRGSWPARLLETRNP